MKWVCLVALLCLVGCEDPEKDRLRDDVSKFQREIIQLKAQLSAEKTPQQDMVEKMQEQQKKHQTEILQLQSTISQLRDDSVRPSLVGLQIELRSLDSQKEQIHKILARLNNVEKELGNKSSAGHSHLH